MNAPLKSINCGGRLISLGSPIVMEIVNITPDSFFEHGIKDNLSGDIIDVGGCSTRPNAEYATEEEEWQRLDYGLNLIRSQYIDAIISVDTFRPSIAIKSIEKYGVSIINDVSGGCEEMFKVTAKYGVPYILTFNEIIPKESSVVACALKFFADRIQRLCELGQNDIIIDPGFGFNKTIDQNFELMNNLEQLKILGRPLLVGISRKSMIFKTLGGEAKDALNGTTVLNTISLTKGADILRVHDVKEARECIGLIKR